MSTLSGYLSAPLVKLQRSIWQQVRRNQSPLTRNSSVMPAKGGEHLSLQRLQSSSFDKSMAGSAREFNGEMTVHLWR